jgi:hypothetical protein
MNKRSKGRRNENRAKEELEREGWLVEQAKGSTRWNKQTDIFGLWDILAIKKVEIGIDCIPTLKMVQKRRWIQVKSNKFPNLKPFIEFKEKYCDENDLAEIWVWEDYNRKGWKKKIV